MRGSTTTEDNLRTALAQSQAQLRQQERAKDPNYRRNLTDDDVAAIVDLLQERVTNQFYQDVGKGVWALAKKAFVVLLLALAAYGFYGHVPK